MPSIRNLNRSHFLVILLIISIGINTVSHFSSPAYRFYKSSADKLDKRFDTLRDQVKNDFMPALYLLATNTPSSVSQTISALPSVSSFSNRLQKLVAFPFKVSGHWGFTFEGVSYFAGDDFFGSKIVKVSPTFVQTQVDHFYITSNSASR